MGLLFLFIVTLATSSLASGNSCVSILTTAFGYAGSVTATFNEHGMVSYLNDGFRVENDRRVPWFSKDSLNLNLGSFGRPQKASSIVHEKRLDGYFALVDYKGILRFTLGDGRSLPVRVPGDAHVSAAAFYRHKLREFERHWVPIRNLLSIPEAECPGGRVGHCSDTLKATLPEYLYVLSDDKIYLSTLLKRSFASLPESVQAELQQGRIVRVRKTEGAAEKKNKLTFEAQMASLIDFSDLNGMPGVNSVLVPATNPDEVIEITAFDQLVTLTSEALSKASDFFEVLSPTKVVLASEAGQVFVIDPIQKRTLGALKFPREVWLQSLSAYQVGETIHIWAIDGISRKIFHWETNEKSNVFAECPMQLPDSAVPFHIASAGEAITAGFTLKKLADSGYYTHVGLGKDEIEVSRVIVQSQAGAIYAWMPEAKKMGEPDGQFRWVTHSFE